LISKFSNLAVRRQSGIKRRRQYLVKTVQYPGMRKYPGKIVLQTVVGTVIVLTQQLSDARGLLSGLA